MPSLPEQVTSYLSRAAVGAYAAAYLQLDADGTLHSLGGSLATFGLGHLTEGDVDADALFFLEGLVPHTGPPLFLPCLSFAPDVTADLHLFSEEDRTWALLLDTTVSAHEQRRFQQHLYLRSLSDPPGPRGSDVPALLAETLTALNVLVLEYQDDGALSVRGLAPEWSHSLFASPGGSPSSVRARGPLSFLGHFLEEARHFWSTAGSGTLRSGLWQEPSTGGTEFFFEARALLVDRHRLLLIERLLVDDAEPQRLIQVGRSQHLDHLRRLKAVEQQAVLLHCIAHDLAGPLAGIQASLSLLNTELLSGEGREYLDAALKQSNKFGLLIREISQTLTRDALPSAPDPLTPEMAPDLLLTARSLVNSLHPLALLHNVSLHLNEPSDPHRRRPVHADRLRLERVLFNLLEHALWRSPSGSTVGVHIEDEGPFLRVAVVDDGLLIPDAAIPALFQRLSPEAETASFSGIGLYFCRITVERWGGAIGYTTSPEGKSVFWFRLPRIETAYSMNR